MKELLMLAVGIGMVEKMEEAETMERLEKATSHEEKVAIVRETERFVFEIANDVFRPESEIGEDGVKAKQQFIEGIIGHNYRYFGMENPLDNGISFAELKIRNGFGEAKDEEFFI
jgi:hypothetical protein